MRTDLTSSHEGKKSFGAATWTAPSRRVGQDLRRLQPISCKSTSAALFRRARRAIRSAAARRARLDLDTARRQLAVAKDAGLPVSRPAARPRPPDHHAHSHRHLDLPLQAPAALFREMVHRATGKQ